MNAEACAPIDHHGALRGWQAERLDLGVAGLQRGFRAPGHPHAGRAEVRFVVLRGEGHAGLPIRDCGP